MENEEKKKVNSGEEAKIVCVGALGAVITLDDIRAEEVTFNGKRYWNILTSDTGDLVGSVFEDGTFQVY